MRVGELRYDWIMSDTARSLRIAELVIGLGHRPFIVAEMSGNHHGDLGRALAIVDMIAESGAQAVKLQTYRADTITLDVDGPAFRITDGHGLWGGQSLYQLYERAHTPWEWHEPLFARARERGLVPFSSPFDGSAVDLLEGLEAPAYKIASLEIADVGLLRRGARTGKPVILSTGAADSSDIDLAVRTVRAEGNNEIVVLACTSSYPAPPEETNLRSIPTLRDTWDVMTGLSDHTLGIGVSIAAVAFGACVLERHVTLSRNDTGVDSSFSLEPGELRSLVEESERAWLALGDVHLGATGAEAESRRLRRSLYVASDVRAGDVATTRNVRSVRPAGGLEPRFLNDVLGRRFTRDAVVGTPVTWDLV